MSAAMKFEVVSFDEFQDFFKLCRFNGDVEKSDIELDDFWVPAPIVASLCGMWGEPHEFIGKVIEFKLPN